MFKVNNRDTGKRHWLRSDVFIVNFTYFTRYSSAYLVDFEQVNVSWEPTLWISIYPRAEGDIALLYLLLIFFILILSLILNMYR